MILSFLQVTHSKEYSRNTHTNTPLYNMSILFVSVQVDEVPPERERDEAAPWDVAAILDRYHVLHSDSDESDSEVEWDELDEIL